MKTTEAASPEDATPEIGDDERRQVTLARITEVDAEILDRLAER